MILEVALIDVAAGSEEAFIAPTAKRRLRFWPQTAWSQFV